MRHCGVRERRPVHLLPLLVFAAGAMLLALYMWMTAAGGPRVAVVCLAVRPNDELRAWTRRLRRELDPARFAVFVLADGEGDDSSDPDVCDDVPVLRYPDAQVVAAGFWGMNWLVDEPKKAAAFDADVVSGADAVPGEVPPVTRTTSAWAKAVFAVAYDERLAGFDRAWLIEADVLVPSAAALARLTERTLLTSDFVAAPAHRYRPDDAWPHWDDLAEAGVAQPWYRSLVCLLGVSRAYVARLEAFVARHRRMFFLESMLNIVAETAPDLRVSRPIELSAIVWGVPPPSVQSVLAYPHFFYHSVKDELVQAYARARLALLGMDTAAGVAAAATERASAGPAAGEDEYALSDAIRRRARELSGGDDGAAKVLLRACDHYDALLREADRQREEDRLAAEEALWQPESPYDWSGRPGDDDGDGNGDGSAADEWPRRVTGEGVRPSAKSGDSVLAGD